MVPRSVGGLLGHTWPEQFWSVFMASSSEPDALAIAIRAAAVLARRDTRPLAGEPSVADAVAAARNLFSFRLLEMFTTLTNSASAIALIILTVATVIVNSAVCYCSH